MDISTQGQLSVSELVSYPPCANIPPPVKGFLFDPLEDALGTKGGSWERFQEFGP